VSLDLADPALAVLRMPTWATYDSRWDWAGFLAASFAELARRGTPALVIDLRGNQGGTTAVGDALLARITDRELAVAGAARVVRYRRIPDDLRPHVDTWDPGFLDWGDAATGPDGGGRYRLADAADGRVLPVGPRFGGAVVVLVDAAVSSATFRFAHLVRAHRLGVLVGQPTGGNQRGTTGGAILFLRLPRSGIEVDVPLIADVPPGDPPDAGLTPDVVTAPRPADLAAGVDTELAAARTYLAAPAVVDRGGPRRQTPPLDVR
jgi:C-terminal processing protease CtpA/Prc